MEIRPITADETHRVRRQLLYAQDERAEVSYPGDVDARAIHLGVFVGVSLVGVASFIPQDLPSRTGGMRIRGVAVQPAIARQGVGRKLLEQGMSLCVEQGAAYVWCNARESSIPFFQRLGFKSISDLFDVEATGLHRRMVKQFPAKEVS